jgi:hypothetical protein
MTPLNFVPATKSRVPHISLVFCEMWDTTALDAADFLLSLGAKPRDLQFTPPATITAGVSALERDLAPRPEPFQGYALRRSTKKTELPRPESRQIS